MKYNLTTLLFISAFAIAQEEPKPLDLPGHLLPEKSGWMTVSASALYWKPHEERLDYVLRNDNGTLLPNNATVKRFDFDWSGGFRVSAGGTIPKMMDLDLVWTRYQSKGKTSEEALSQFSTLYSVWTFPGQLSSESNASMSGRLLMNLLDLQMSALFSPRPFLDLRTCFSLLGASIHQKYELHLSGGSTNQVQNRPVLDDHIQMSNNFSGGGPKIGLDTTWILGKGLSVIGNASLALLYGRFEVTQTENYLVEGFTEPRDLVGLKNNFTLTRTFFDFLLGLRWDYLLMNKSSRLTLEAVWENLLFLGQNEMVRFPTDGQSNAGITITGKGDLSFQGLSFKAAFSF